LACRPNRTLVPACTEDPPLIAKILGHVQRRETLIGTAARPECISAGDGDWASDRSIPATYKTGAVAFRAKCVLINPLSALSVRAGTGENPGYNSYPPEI